MSRELDLKELATLPLFSIVYTPNALTQQYKKLGDGYFYPKSWLSDNVFDMRLDQDFPDGSLACLTSEELPKHFVKRGPSWLNVNPSRSAFTPDIPFGHRRAEIGASPVSNSSPPIIDQTPYRNGKVPTGVDAIVQFDDVPMLFAEKGDVSESTSDAFTGELASKQKVSIRFGFPKYGVCGYQEKQHNIRSANGVGFSRGKVAALVAREVRLLLDKMQSHNCPLSFEGKPVAFEDLVLVDVRHVSPGSIQPTIAVLPQKYL
ncbi:hypothetical protein BD309DRAFT_777760 [Dichomitus squalens]|nr:hypothetical protein BD309DRAFT_777760 [Dichomitus squalens]